MTSPDARIEGGQDCATESRDRLPASASRIALFCCLPQLCAWSLVTLLSTRRLTTQVWSDVGVYRNWTLEFHSMFDRPAAAAAVVLLGIGVAAALCVGSRESAVRRSLLYGFGLAFSALLLAWTRKVTGIIMGFYDDPWRNDLVEWVLLTGIGPLCVHLGLRGIGVYRSVPIAEVAHLFLLASVLCMDIFAREIDHPWLDVLVLSDARIALWCTGAGNLLLVWVWSTMSRPRAAWGPGFVAVVSTLQALVLARKLGCFIQELP